LSCLSAGINRLAADGQRFVADEFLIVGIAPHHVHEIGAAVEECARRRIELIVPKALEIAVDADHIVRCIALSAARIRCNRIACVSERGLEGVAIVLFGRSLHCSQPSLQIERRWSWRRLRFHLRRLGNCARRCGREALGAFGGHRRLSLAKHFDCWI